MYEPKFKIGDKVIVYQYYHSDYNGKKLKITKLYHPPAFNCRMYYGIDNNGLEWAFDEEYLKLDNEENKMSEQKNYVKLFKDYINNSHYTGEGGCEWDNGFNTACEEIARELFGLKIKEQTTYELVYDIDESW